MSLDSLSRYWLDSRGAADALAALSDSDAADILAALPASSALSPEDHDDARQVAVVIASARLASGEPVPDAVRYAWTAARDEALRYPSTATDSDTLDPYADTYPERTTLARSDAYRPDAAYAWTASDTVTVALSLVDDRTRALVDILAGVDPSAWWGGLPERDTLAALARLAGVRLSARTARAEVRDALAALADACRVVVDWQSAARARDYWTDDAASLSAALADAVALSLDCRGRTYATGSGTSGPASGVVVRYRDTLADAWRVVVGVDAVETVDESGEPVTVDVPTLTLRALSDDDAADILADAHAVRPYVRTRSALDSDAWTERLGWTPGAVRKSSGRKGSRVGSTGPTVPIGSRSGGSGAPLGLALGTFTVHPVRPIPHPVTERTAESAARISARTAHAARVAERDAALLATAEHAARVESATERARLAARALHSTDTRPSAPAARVEGPSRSEWEWRTGRA